MSGPSRGSLRHLVSFSVLGLVVGFVLGFSVFNLQIQTLILANMDLRDGEVRLRNEANSLTTRINSLEAERVRLQGSVSSLERDKAQLEALISSLRSDVQRLNDEVRRLGQFESLVKEARSRFSKDIVVLGLLRQFNSSGFPVLLADPEAYSMWRTEFSRALAEFDPALNPLFLAMSDAYLRLNDWAEREPSGDKYAKVYVDWLDRLSFLLLDYTEKYQDLLAALLGDVVKDLGIVAS